MINKSELEFWEQIEHDFMLIKAASGIIVAPSKYAKSKPKNIPTGDWYGSYAPPMKQHDEDVLKKVSFNESELIAMVEKQLIHRKITKEFFLAWAELNCCHGILMLARSAKQDDYHYSRGGQGREKKDKKLWLALVTQNISLEIKNRAQIEKKIVNFIRKIESGKICCPDQKYQPDWFADFLSSDEEALKAQYLTKKFSSKTMKKNIEENHGKSNIPPTDFAAYKKLSP